MYILITYYSTGSCSADLCESNGRIIRRSGITYSTSRAVLLLIMNAYDLLGGEGQKIYGLDIHTLDYRDHSRAAQTA